MDYRWLKRVGRRGRRNLVTWGEVGAGFIPGCYGLGADITIMHGDTVHAMLRILSLHLHFNVTAYLDRDDSEPS